MKKIHLGLVMLPSLSALRAFDQAARGGSFKAAALALNVSPTAISHHIRTLEDDLGVALFLREGRRVTLTPEGQKLSVDVGAAFTQLAEAVDRTRQTQRDQVIRIAAGPFFAARWLIPRLATFWQEYPRISLEVVPIPQRLSEHVTDADIVISWDEVTAENAHPLLTLTPFAIASPDLIARFGQPARPSDLLNMPLIHQRDTSGWADWLVAMGVTVEEKLRGAVFEDANAVLRGAVDGQGVTLGWMPLIEHELETGRVVKLFDQSVAWKKQYFVSVSQRGRRNAASGSVLEWLRKEGGQ